MQTHSLLRSMCFVVLSVVDAFAAAHGRAPRLRFRPAIALLLPQDDVDFDPSCRRTSGHIAVELLRTARCSLSRCCGRFKALTASFLDRVQVAVAPLEPPMNEDFSVERSECKTPYELISQSVHGANLIVMRRI